MTRIYMLLEATCSLEGACSSHLAKLATINQMLQLQLETQYMILCCHMLQTRLLASLAMQIHRRNSQACVMHKETDE